MSKITLVGARDIALDRLVASDANVRRIKAGVSVEDLAEDIARRGLLQSLSVRPVLDAENQETGKFSVSAGGRRLAALKLLVKQKRLAKNAPVPCIVKTEGIEEEDSLAENTMREALHPLDQFRAFKNLHDHGLSIDDIAARFFVGSQVVRQRLKLAAASQKLLDLYVAEEMTLEQLTAFCVTDDHARQEAIWEALSRSHNTQPYAIRRMLTEGAVKPGDKRAIFVGVEAYEAAGGVILRDLFVHDHGGWLQEVALLDRLAREKLNAAVEEIRAEGWKWSEVAIDFPYGHSNGLRRLPANYAPVSEEQQARYDAALAEYSRLSDENEGADELSEEVDQKMAELEKEIAAGDERPAIYDPADIARAGVFVSINYAGGLKVERGYVRPEDEAPVGPRRVALQPDRGSCFSVRSRRPRTGLREPRRTTRPRLPRQRSPKTKPRLGPNSPIGCSPSSRRIGRSRCATPWPAIPRRRFSPRLMRWRSAPFTARSSTPASISPSVALRSARTRRASATAWRRGPCSNPSAIGNCDCRPIPRTFGLGFSLRIKTFAPNSSRNASDSASTR